MITVYGAFILILLITFSGLLYTLDRKGETAEKQIKRWYYKWYYKLCYPNGIHPNTDKGICLDMIKNEGFIKSISVARKTISFIQVADIDEETRAMLQKMARERYEKNNNFTL